MVLTGLFYSGAKGSKNTYIEREREREREREFVTRYKEKGGFCVGFLKKR
jgi:hypothetical protein